MMWFVGRQYNAFYGVFLPRQALGGGKKVLLMVVFCRKIFAVFPRRSFCDFNGMIFVFGESWEIIAIFLRKMGNFFIFWVVVRLFFCVFGWYMRFFADRMRALFFTGYAIVCPACH
ncbi:MAG: hypothetical protein Q4D61_03590 [Cardiobacteriaceae bacterium]|nr:hypothetical protein [Cardiobacteriaceae bacterium]